jgi:hypothetical protein
MAVRKKKHRPRVDCYKYVIQFVTRDKIKTQLVVLLDALNL